MRIVNPEYGENGIDKENIFIALNSNDQKVGYGFLSISYNPKFSVTFPLNIYFKIDAKGNVKSRLFGAIIARAYQYCQSTYANLSARIYTDIDPEDTEGLQFYQYSGLKNDDRDEIIQIRIPQANEYNLSGCEIRELTLSNDAEFTAFINRLNDNRLTPLDKETLIKCSESEHFIALAVIYQNYTLGELVFYGNGSRVTLLSMYIDISYRNKGLAKYLLRNAMLNLKSRGVTDFYSLLQRRSGSQRYLAKACRYRAIKTTKCYPGISIVKTIQGIN